MSDAPANEFDVIVIGAGPAGLTAGLYAARGGLSVAVFERISPGGQLAQTSEVENYPGFPNGAEGWQLAFDMQQQALNFGVKIITEEVTGVDFSGDRKQVVTPNGTYAAKSVIVATGAHHRELGLPGEHELQGKGVSYCATCDGNFFRGKDVIVVGGGNTAVGDALYLRVSAIGFTWSIAVISFAQPPCTTSVWPRWRTSSSFGIQPPRPSFPRKALSRVFA